MTGGHDVMFAPSATECASTSMFKLMCKINDLYSLNLTQYSELHRWSCENLQEFWQIAAEDCALALDGPAFSQEPTLWPRIPWFPKENGFNFAKCLLHTNVSGDYQAIVSIKEGSDFVEEYTISQLREKVAHWRRALSQFVKPGDRVAACVPNCAEAICALLATASIGALWSSTSPEFGVNAILDRFGQITPTVVITIDGVFYSGKVHSMLDNLRAFLPKLPSVKQCIIIPFVNSSQHLWPVSSIENSIGLEDFLAASEKITDPGFKLGSFETPLFIMYSSGTTGPPKCIVHSAGGVLLKVMTEQKYHCDMGPSDRLLFFTTAGWMMWQWTICALGLSVPIVLYNGSALPSNQPSLLFDLCAKFDVTILGISPRYLAVLQSQDCIGNLHLPRLRLILSTGAPLSEALFKFVYSSIKTRPLILGSITGGTDICGCFALSCPILPVHAGEIQCAAIGVAVDCISDCESNSNSVPSSNDVCGSLYDEEGELVCLKPFPSTPLYFWNDESNILYQKAYFAAQPGKWVHGDWCFRNSHTGGWIMLGRSDSVLNPYGVRFGSGEIYSVLETCPLVDDSICCAQRNSKTLEERVILFVKPTSEKNLSSEDIKEIKSYIRRLTSPRHVPAVVLGVTEIPYTVSGKKVEVVVRKIINNQPVTNTNAISNPSCLNQYRDREELKEWS